MKIRWYSNACVLIEARSGARILCDPWVNSGAFLGSWFQWPPLPEDFEEQLLSMRVDGVYISHLHPDHYDPRFISKFSRLNPQVPIYIASFAHKWLKQSISSVVSAETKVIELATNVKFSVKEDLSIQVFAADTCNPLICGASIACQTEPHLRGIDSIAVFEANGFRIVNANDAIGVRLVPKIAANIGQADLIMGHYGGASPYPQCFTDVSDKKVAGFKVINAACDTLLLAADSIKAKYVMPFAGQYVLGGRLVGLNPDRATLPLDEAVNLLRSKTDKEVISIRPGGEINLCTGDKDSDYVEPTFDATTYYLQSIAKAKFSYEKVFSKSWLDFSTNLIRAAEPVIRKSEALKLSFNNSFVIGDGDHFVTINLGVDKNDRSYAVGVSPKFETVTSIEMPESLLYRLSNRVSDYKGFTTMHWNQADVGSHFTWKRVGPFDLSAHSLLNFFGT
jgi:UDP-MurNAc hydroxylase